MEARTVRARTLGIRTQILRVKDGGVLGVVAWNLHKRRRGDGKMGMGTPACVGRWDDSRRSVELAQSMGCLGTSKWWPEPIEKRLLSHRPA